MEVRPLKTLEDFPKFVVTALRRGPTATEGYTHFEIDGSFDRAIKLVGPQWFWLLIGKRGCLCASVRSLNEPTNEAVLTFDAREQPDIVGSTLFYFPAGWQAFHVWMVLDPNWGWERKQFAGADAIAETYQSRNVSIVNGREVTAWTKLSPANTQPGQSRHYPAADPGASASEPRLIPLGWDHEHCELCREHIDIGMFGYRDSNERWVCENCYARYVTRRDLAFVDEL